MKKAFTLLELIFVIVVVGILAAVVLPNTHRDPLREAAVQLISHIRYTQHLAMIDDKFDANEPMWYRQRWQLAFSTAAGTESYYIFADSPSAVGAYDGNPGANNTYTDVEVARNPAKKDSYLIGVPFGSFDNSAVDRLSTELNVGSKYGIGNITVSGGGTGSNANRILFDHLGRPYRGNNSTLTSAVHRIATTAIFVKLCTNTCVNPAITANNANEIVIRIEPETGYARIL